MEWISVKDRLPDDLTSVLVYFYGAGFESGEQTFAVFSDNKFKVMDISNSLEDYTDIITHWMPLPEPPKED